MAEMQRDTTALTDIVEPNIEIAEVTSSEYTATLAAVSKTLTIPVRMDTTVFIAKYAAIATKTLCFLLMIAPRVIARKTVQKF